jgi:hypothetical protein
MVVGAGTVLSQTQADLALEAGAAFAVAPASNPELVRHCRERGLPFFPGIATPSELDRAVGLGLSLVKVFPAAQVGGPGFLRAVSAVYPGVGFMPTGGISAENLAGYLAVPAVVACGGSWLMPPDAVADGDFGRRRSRPPRLAPVRRRRPRRPQRAELHRARLRRARSRRLLRSRPHGGGVDASGGGRLGLDLRRRRGALVPHGRDLRRPLRDHRRRGCRGLAAARRHGVVVSYDLNYRPSLWKSIGGRARAAEVNRALVGSVDVLLGNEEDFSAALGFDVGFDEERLELDLDAYRPLLEEVLGGYPRIAVVATTLRRVRTATLNDWSAVCTTRRDGFVVGPSFEGLEVLDRVGGGDSFASGFFYGLLEGHDEVERLRRGASPRVQR